MNRAFKELFDPIKADEGLKERTQAFLAGQTWDYSHTRAEKRRRPAYTLAACACLLLVLLGGHWLYFTPTAEISIDINPSIELGINRFDRVVCVSAFNEDGHALADTLDVKYKNYTQAIEQLLDQESVTALLSDGEVMTITVVGSDGAQSASILSGVEACTAGHHNTYCHAATSEEVAGAHESGLSCGKYRAFLELQRLDLDITPEAVQNMTMREIQDLVDSLRAEGGIEPSPSPSSSWDSGSSGQHGQHHNYGGHHGGHG